MFTITFESETYRSWESDFVFTTFQNAKEYLVKEGFVERNRIYYRENYNWCKYIKAYICPRKVYQTNVSVSP